jgi:hypothetical protein
MQLSQRGCWLAPQPIEYASAVDETLWETGMRGARLMLLRQLRRHDPIGRGDAGRHGPAKRAAIALRFARTSRSG